VGIAAASRQYGTGYKELVERKHGIGTVPSSDRYQINGGWSNAGHEELEDVLKDVELALCLHDAIL
jgi:hypothetical protein